MTYCYFVSYHTGTCTFGNASVLLKHKIETYRDVRKVEKMLETNLGMDEVIILNWKGIALE